MKSPRSNQNNIRYNQLIWAPGKDGKRVANWPAVILNPQEWKNVSKSLKPTKNYRLIWWLRPCIKYPMAKVLKRNLHDFVSHFRREISLRMDASRTNAIAQAVQVAILASGREQRKDLSTPRDLLSVMEKLARKTKKVFVETEDQWKLVIPEKYHRELVDPYFTSNHDDTDADSDEDLRIAEETCDPVEVVLCELENVENFETTDEIQNSSLADETENEIQKSPVPGGHFFSVTDKSQASNESENCPSSTDILTFEPHISSSPAKKPPDEEFLSALFLKPLPPTADKVSLDKETQNFLGTDELSKSTSNVDFCDQCLPPIPKEEVQTASVNGVKKELLEDSCPCTSVEADCKMEHIVSRPITGNLSLLVKFPCPFCPTTMSDFGEMRRHLRKHGRNFGPGKKLFVCSMCSFASDSELDIISHSRLHFDTQI